MADPSEKAKDLFQTKEANNTSSMYIAEFLTRQYIDHFLSCSFPEELTPITNAINRRLSLPKLGDHLVTPRTGYYHHGVYAGDERVIHYAGFAKELNAKPVEEVSLFDFMQNRSFQVKPHPNSKFSQKDIVYRARSRLLEDRYHLIFNNCEHFVNWCIYNVSESKQVGIVGKTVAATIKTIKNRSGYVAIATAVVDAGQYFRAYLKGDISKEKLFEEISHTAVTTTSAFYYAGLGQVAIPIPVVGALVGAGVGYFIGNVLTQSGLIALGDSQIVRAAKDRRQAVQTLCDMLVPEIRRSRIQLQQCIDKYFYERNKEFEQAFSMLDSSLGKWNSDQFAAGLERINNQFDTGLQFKTFAEFDRFMESDETFRF